MTALALHDFSDFLLRLYRLAHESSIETFQDAALGLVKPLIAFDASMWGTATTDRDGIDVRTLHLHQKTPEMMRATAAVPERAQTVSRGRPHAA